MEPVIVVLVIVVAAVAGYLAWRADQKRREELHAFAVNRGWVYTPADDSWCQRWPGPPFGQGDHRRARNVLTGADPSGRPLVAFDYSYQTHSTDSKGNRTTTTHHHHVVALHLPTWLPRLSVTPENLLTRFGDALGLVSDIDLESEDFNRRFRVKAGDAKFAYDVLHPRAMEMLLARSPLSWRIEGADILCWDDGRMSPSGVLEAMALLGAVVDGIPSYVWKDYAPEAGAPRAGTPEAREGGSA